MAVPQATGKVLFDARTDVVQIGMVALALVVGRPIGESEFPQGLEKLLDGAKELTAPGTAGAAGTLRPLSAELRAWLERTLPIERRVAFATVREAQQEFEKLFSGKRYASSAGALKALVARFHKGMGQGSQPVDGTEHAPAGSSASFVRETDDAVHADMGQGSEPQSFPASSGTRQPARRGAGQPAPTLSASMVSAPAVAAPNRSALALSVPTLPVPTPPQPIDESSYASSAYESPVYEPSPDELLPHEPQVRRPSTRGSDVRPSDPPPQMPGPSEETDVAITPFADSVTVQPKLRTRTRPRRALVTPIEDSISREESVVQTAVSLPSTPLTKPSTPGAVPTSSSLSSSPPTTSSATIPVMPPDVAQARESAMPVRVDAPAVPMVQGTPRSAKPSLVSKLWALAPRPKSKAAPVPPPPPLPIVDVPAAEPASAITPQSAGRVVPFISVPMPVVARPGPDEAARAARGSRSLLHAGAGFLGIAAAGDDTDSHGHGGLDGHGGHVGHLGPVAHTDRADRADRAGEPDRADTAVSATPARRSSSRARINWRRTLAASLVIAALEGVAFATAYWYVTPTETGALLIETSPPGLEVLVDGRPAGRTPYSDSLAPGRHTIELRQGTATRVIPVEISAGVQTLQRVTWSKGLKTGQARITATAPNAHVTIDGRKQGKAPLTISTLAAGKHIVQVESDAGTVTTPIAVSPGETTELDVPVYPGWVSVLASVELFIFEGERFLGTTEGEKLLLSPGRHALTFASETLGYRRTLEVTVIPGATAAVSLPMPRVPVTIDGPAGADLIVDGQPVGKLPLPELTVPLGTRDFLFKHPDFGERRQVVTATLLAPVRVVVARQAR